MARAIWNGVTIAESDATRVVDGNHYFPREAVKSEHLAQSASETVCSWKGTASYHDVVVHGERNRDAAWYYADPTPAAAEIAGYIAFWRGVQVVA